MKYEITHTCGHVEAVQLYGKASERVNREAYLQTTMCPECYRMAQNRKAAEQAAQQGLPKLLGTEKQVIWAETLRQKAINALTAEIEKAQAVLDDIERQGGLEQALNNSNATPEQRESVTARLENLQARIKIWQRLHIETEAKWFIDNR